MRYLINLSLFSIILFFTSCTREPLGIGEVIEPQVNPEGLYPGKQLYGWAKGTKNDYTWEASSYFSFHVDGKNFIGMSFNTYSIEGYLRESFGFDEIPFDSIGVRRIKRGPSRYYDGACGSSYARLESDGDLLTAFYDLDESASDNIIEITRIDVNSRIVEGNFSATFLLEGYNPYYPKVARFENVKFSSGFYQE